MCMQPAIDMGNKGGEFPGVGEFPDFPRVGELTDEEMKKQMMIKQQMMEKQRQMELERQQQVEGRYIHNAL